MPRSPPPPSMLPRRADAKCWARISVCKSHEICHTWRTSPANYQWGMYHPSTRKDRGLITTKASLVVAVSPFFLLFLLYAPIKEAERAASLSFSLLLWITKVVSMAVLVAAAAESLSSSSSPSSSSSWDQKEAFSAAASTATPH